MFNILCEGSSLSSAFKVRGSYGCPSCRIGVLVPDGFFKVRNSRVRALRVHVRSCDAWLSVHRSKSFDVVSIGFRCRASRGSSAGRFGRLAPAVPALMSEQGERSCSSQRATCRPALHAWRSHCVAVAGRAKRVLLVCLLLIVVCRFCNFPPPMSGRAGGGNARRADLLTPALRVMVSTLSRWSSRKGTSLPLSAGLSGMVSATLCARCVSRALSPLVASSMDDARGR